MPTAEELRKKARNYRRLVATTGDQRAIDSLMGLAAEYDAQADAMDELEAAKARRPPRIDSDWH